jgi:Holliday junction resolvase-like predicted endonuclease
MTESAVSEKLARNAIEKAGFEVHDANIVFRANCPNIDLVVYGKEQAIYVQVKSSRNPAGKNCITIDGSPWTDGQLYKDAAIYNKHDDFKAKLVVLVDIEAGGSPEFYVVPPDELERSVRRKGQEFAGKLKRDGTKRSINFRKELPKEDLSRWLSAWHLLGEPRKQSEHR